MPPIRHFALRLIRWNEVFMSEISHGGPRRGLIIGAVTAIVIGIIVAVMLIGGKTAPEAQPDEGVPDPGIAEAREWDAVLETSAGPISVALDGAAAPQAVANFITLARDGFFNGTECHRLLPESLLQCGDPTGTGTGGPGYSFGPIENAPTSDVYPAGSVAMARIGGDGSSMGSQFFLVFDDVRLPSDRAGGYSVMGTINSGLELLVAIGQEGTVDGSMDGRPLTSVIIESVEVQ